MTLEIKLRELERVESSLETAAVYITEAGDNLNRLNDVVTGVVGNPFNTIIAFIDISIKSLKTAGQDLRNSKNVDDFKVKLIKEDVI